MPQEGGPHMLAATLVIGGRGGGVLRGGMECAAGGRSPLLQLLLYQTFRYTEHPLVPMRLD